MPKRLRRHLKPDHGGRNLWLDLLFGVAMGTIIAAMYWLAQIQAAS